MFVAEVAMDTEYNALRGCTWALLLALPLWLLLIGAAVAFARWAVG